MKNFSIIITLFLFYSYSTKKQEKNVRDHNLIQLLTQVLVDSLKENQKNMLFIFISDNMCSGCIEKEFLNIKSADIEVSLIGLFYKKRIYAATARQITWVRDIFIQREEKHSNVIPLIFYFVYNPKEKTCTELFFPEPCNEAETFSYFQKIKDTLLLDE